MSKISIVLLYTVILGIITGMYFEVPYVSGKVGAFIVFALVYAFIVAKREAALMSHALTEIRREAHEAEAQDEDEDENDQPIIPEWLRRVPQTGVGRSVI